MCERNGGILTLRIVEVYERERERERDREREPPTTPQHGAPPSAQGQPGLGGDVLDLGMDPQSVPPEYKKEGSDWFAVFNPKFGLNLLFSSLPFLLV